MDGVPVSQQANPLGSDYPTYPTGAIPYFATPNSFPPAVTLGGYARLCLYVSSFLSFTLIDLNFD